jgi:hypothetical protein
MAPGPPTRGALLLVLWRAVGAGAAEAFIDTAALPGDPAAPQASVLYYRDGTTILDRAGVTDHSDIPLSTVPTARSPEYDDGPDVTGARIGAPVTSSG